MRIHRLGVLHVAALALARVCVPRPAVLAGAVPSTIMNTAPLQDGNPAELWEARGAALWKEKRGPKNASLEQCDRAGRRRDQGAYTRLPRILPDADRVMDLETRIVSCMVTLQGFSRHDAKKSPFGGPDRKADMGARRVRDLRVARRQDECRA